MTSSANTNDRTSFTTIRPFGHIKTFSGHSTTQLCVNLLRMVLLPDRVLNRNMRFTSTRYGPSLTRYAIKREIQEDSKPGFGSAAVSATIASLALLKGSITSLVIVALIVWFVFRRPKEVVEERVDLISNIGVQLSVIYSDGSSNHKIVHSDEIDDIVLNEAAGGFWINTFLAFVPKNPRLSCALPFEHSTLPLSLSAELLFILREQLRLDPPRQ